MTGPSAVQRSIRRHQTVGLAVVAVLAGGVGGWAATTDISGAVIAPGVLVVEAMAQAAAVIVIKTLDLIDHDLLVYFMSIEEARFRQPVVPGDVLELHVEILRRRGKVWKFRADGKVGDTLCAEAIFTAMIVEPKG